MMVGGGVATAGGGVAAAGAAGATGAWCCTLRRMKGKKKVNLGKKTKKQKNISIHKKQ